MGGQTGPYREAETIDEEDIRRITGVLYGGKTLPSELFSVMLNEITIAATDTVGILPLACLTNH